MEVGTPPLQLVLHTVVFRLLWSSCLSCKYSECSYSTKMFLFYFTLGRSGAPFSSKLLSSPSLSSKPDREGYNVPNPVGCCKGLTMALQKECDMCYAVLSRTVMSDFLWPHQATLSLGFSRQEYWSGLPCPLPGDLPDPGIEPRSPTLQADSLPSVPPGKLKNTGVGSWSFLQRNFLTQESNPGLLHCRQILYQLSYPGSLHIHISLF